VEDNLIVQKVHQIMLSELGYRVEIADCGHTALDLMLVGKRYDVIFMDVGLPDMSGLEVTKLLRENEHKHHCPYTPVVAMTAYAHEEDRQNCLQAGMDAVVVKPIDVSDLQKVLATIHEKYSVEQAS
jgi:CheY-like chemotaxis protein